MVFGPNKYQSQIEGSKHYSKKLMEELDIPTSNFVYLDSYERAKNFYSSEVAAKEMVIKYNGLAKGKGVFLPDTVEESLSIVKNYFTLQNNSGVIVEDRLYGTEVSVFGFL